jgi:hypothetical protein
MNSRIILSAALMALAGAAQAQSPVVEWTSPRLEGSTRHPGSCCTPEEENAMATDAAGNVYIVGYRPLGPATVWTVSKLSASGELLWQASNNGPERRFDYAYAVAVDPNGDPVVTGASSQGGWPTFLTIKFSGADGSQLWERRWRAAEGGYGAALAIDAAGDVVVIGTARTRQIGTDYATVKYRGSDGEQLWASTYGRVTNETDAPTAVALDRNGNVFVTGASGSSQFSNFATIKYDGATGAQLWVALYAPKLWGSSVAHFGMDIAVDGQGDPVVTGDSFGERFRDFATIKYDGATGAQRWVARFDAGISRDDQPKAVAIDANDDVYVTGASWWNVPESNWRMATVKYSGINGSEVWRAISQSPWASKESAYALAVDANGVQVAGWATGADGKYFPAAIGYSTTTGAQHWAAPFAQASSDNTATVALKPAGAGALYLGVKHYYTADAFFIKRLRMTP